MPEWLWYAAFGFNIGSGLAWWLALAQALRRESKRRQAYWHEVLYGETVQAAPRQDV